jgi:hypothetical protein
VKGKEGKREGGREGKCWEGRGREGKESKRKMGEGKGRERK